MGERLFIALFKYPWMTVLLFVGITALVASTKKLFEMFTSDVDALASAGPERRAKLDKALEIIRERNQRVTDELLALTDLARRQLLGRADPEVGSEVGDIVARLDRLIDTFDKDRHQPWVRAVVDNYRASVSALMQRHIQQNESPEVLVEALEEIHRKAVSDLQLRWSKDGKVKVMYPTDAEGRPFRLQK